jgi:hypothetical protein
MRTQQGSLFQSHAAWYVRYREHGKKNPVAHRLASQAEYPKKSEVIPLKNEYIDRLNRIGFTSRAGGGIIDFVEKLISPRLRTGWLGARLKATRMLGGATLKIA